MTIALVGTDSNDIMAGTSIGLNIIYGLGGNDKISVQDSHATTEIYGGAGNDTIAGSLWGADYIDGGPGSDALYGNWGNDTILSGDGDDYIDGGAGDDIIYTGAGNDIVQGNYGNDTIYVGPGTKKIDGGPGTDTAVFAGNYADYGLSATSGVMTVVGSEGASSLTNFEMIKFNNGFYNAFTGLFMLDKIMSMLGIALVSDTGSSSTDGVTSDPAITGFAQANIPITIKEGSTTLGTAAADSTGTWSFTPSGLTDGPHTLTASQTDLAGNSGTAMLSFSLDTVAPTVSMALVSDTSSSSTDGVTSDPAITGFAQANIPITIKEGSTTLGTAAADSTGTWSFMPSGLTDGPHTLTASQTDLAGNSGTATLSFTFERELGDTIYYVSDSGDDSNNGLSDSSPWKTLDKVSTYSFQPGDEILFKAGDTFSGLLYLDSSSDSASPDNPITISSYGDGKATINAGAGNGIFVYNLGGIEIKNLTVIGSGLGSNNGKGISFYNDLTNTILEDIVIDNVDISGFGGTSSNGNLPPSGDGWGILIAPGSATSQYRYVTITNTASHDNAMGGICTVPWTATNGELISDVYVGNVQAYNNTGISGLNNHSGDGIILGGVVRGTIEYSKAYNNGALSTCQYAGPCGIWAYLCDQVTIQFNESYSNKTGSSVDGDGFDLDGGTTNSVMQYNYSHDNDGAGFVVNWYTGVPATQNNTIRYNISENDGRKANDADSPITLHANNSADLIGTNVYNNTIYDNLGALSSIAIYVSSGTTNTSIRNNILVTTGGKKLLRVASGQKGLSIQGNDYWTSGGAFAIIYSGVTYNSLEAFRGGTGQEKIPLITGSDVGHNLDPLLVNPGGGGTVGTPGNWNILTAYQLQAGSPMINTGLNLVSRFGLNVGVRDFYGTSLPQGGNYDIGAADA